MREISGHDSPDHDRKKEGREENFKIVDSESITKVFDDKGKVLDEEKIRRVEDTQRRMVEEGRRAKTLSRLAKKVAKGSRENVDQLLILGFGFICHLSAYLFYHGYYVDGILVIIIALAIYLVQIFAPPGELKRKVNMWLFQFFLKHAKQGKGMGGSVSRTILGTVFDYELEDKE